MCCYFQTGSVFLCLILETSIFPGLARSIHTQFDFNGWKDSLRTSIWKYFFFQGISGAGLKQAKRVHVVYMVTEDVFQQIPSHLKCILLRRSSSSSSSTSAVLLLLNRKPVIFRPRLDSTSSRIGTTLLMWFGLVLITAAFCKQVPECNTLKCNLSGCENCRVESVRMPWRHSLLSNSPVWGWARMDLFRLLLQNVDLSAKTLVPVLARANAIVIVRLQKISSVMRTREAKTEQEAPPLCCSEARLHATRSQLTGSIPRVILLHLELESHLLQLIAVFFCRTCVRVKHD